MKIERPPVIMLVLYHRMMGRNVTRVTEARTSTRRCACRIRYTRRPLRHVLSPSWCQSRPDHAGRRQKAFVRVTPHECRAVTHQQSRSITETTDEAHHR